MVTAPAATAPDVYPASVTVSYLSGGAWMTASSAPELLPVGIVGLGAMTATATSAQPGTATAPANAIDGNPATIWHTVYSPTKDVPPQSITLTLDEPRQITGLTYQPRQDASANGVVTGYTVYTSADGTTFTEVDSGALAADKSTKTVNLPTSEVRAVRFEATAGVGDYVAAAEIHLVAATR
ncbi:MAG: hypothetical protein GEU96_06225 [Propionibacteriales bacterium]|nr:hypothetical protein [Propionibacteriales bacterium]